MFDPGRIPILLAVCALFAGCAGSQGPEVVSVPGRQYAQAFDTAIAVARSHGMRPALLDRRAGIIETEPVMTGSLLEPWYGDNADFSQALRNTVSRNRIKTRFEFSREGFHPRSQDDEVPPVDLLGLTEPNGDLTVAADLDEPLSLRVWVFEERGHSTGQRRNRWSFIGTTYTYRVPVEGEWDESHVFFWTPTSRDRPAERRLLAEVEARLKQQPAQDLTAGS
jgi:hypothetical protein